MWYDSGEKEYIWALHDDVKQRTIFGDPAAWQCWKETAEEQLNHVNPYTGVAWKDDPMFVAFEYYNELSIDIGREKIAATEENSRWIVDMYVEWLKAKYGTVDKMRQAWNAKDFTPWKRVYKCESFESIKENFHKNADFYRFAFEKMEKFVEVLRRMSCERRATRVWSRRQICKAAPAQTRYAQDTPISS